MVRLNQEIKESEAGKFLADNYGKTVSRRDFDAAFAKSWGKENVKAVKLTCQGNPAYLTEIQISSKLTPSTLRFLQTHSCHNHTQATVAKPL